MKKILIVMAFIGSIFLLAGCGGPKTYEEISFGELKQKIENKEDFILFIGSETCSACSAYKITLNKIIENYGLDVKYIDLDKIGEEDYSYVRKLAYFTGTPATVFIKDGKEDKEKERITGNVKYSKAIKILTENGYIKGE